MKFHLIGSDGKTKASGTVTSFQFLAEPAMTRCDCCHVEKDRDALETYPFPGDGIDTSGPGDPILEVEISGPSGYRVAKVCYACFHRLELDMWASMEQWASLEPKTAYSELPETQP